MPLRSLAVLGVAAGLAVTAGIAGVLMGTSASGWILARLSDTGIVADAAAVGGAAAALGWASILAGAALSGLALALHAGASWARPAGTVVVAAIIAALVGALAAALATLARQPGSAALYGGAATVIGLALAGFGLVLRDLLAGAGGPD